MTESKSKHTTSKDQERTDTHAKGKGASKERSSSGGQLSRSTQRAHWIDALDEHEEHPGETLATRSHDVIRHWAEDRKAQPATIKDDAADSPRVLRFDFPGYGGQNLQAVTWDDWFKTFDDRGLVFLFQEHQKAGNDSNFFHLDSPDREHD